MTLRAALVLLLAHKTVAESCENCDDAESLLHLKVGQRDSPKDHFRGSPSETMKELPEKLATGEVPPYPYYMMTCAGTQALTTESLTKPDYDQIKDKFEELFNSLSSDCNGTVCPQADFAGCTLRLAGHDFMDYDPQEGNGGSDGCLDLQDPDNAGLAECLYKGAEFGVSVADAYAGFCEKVSLADFLVIAAESVMSLTRQLVLDANPDAPTLSLRGGFRYGRNTSKECPWAMGRLPNPENTCNAVKQVYVENMGLSWDEAAALMGVHTLGRARPENSGYDGWWSDAKNSRLFNNNYFVGLCAKGWKPQLAVGGNPNKNQWIRADMGLEKESWAGKEVMLDTDMCLVWSNDYWGKVPMKASTAAEYNCHCAWVGPMEATKSWRNYNDGKFCGTTYVPDDFGRGWGKQRFQCCSVKAKNNRPPVDCGDPQFPKGPAWSAVKKFCQSESKWINVFKTAWKTATTNGFSDLQQMSR